MSARLTIQQKQDRAWTEEAWQRLVLAYAAGRGWASYHPPRAGVARLGTVRSTTPGFPDLTLVRGDRLVFAELKRELGKTTADQDAWLERLRAAGAEAHVWRPSDLETVREVLA